MTTLIKLLSNIHSIQYLPDVSPDYYRECRGWDDREWKEGIAKKEKKGEENAA